MDQSIQNYLCGFDRLSAVKEQILRSLWAEDSTPFPKAWVRSSDLLTLTGQKYFDRRIRELRDEMGCDIETAPLNGEHCYRIKFPNRKRINPRGYLSESKKKALFRHFEFTCQIWGVVLAPGVRGLQADHKIPLMRGGSHSEANWQPICNQCNVGKRSACEGCSDDCLVCPWAFPEKVGKVTLLRLPSLVLEELGKRSGKDQQQLEREIIQILKNDLKIK